MFVYDLKMNKFFKITTDKNPTIFRISYSMALYSYKIFVFGGID